MRLPKNADTTFEEFLGRPKDKDRFNIGDLVEVLHGDSVTLEIVGNLPPSPDYVQYLKENARKIPPKDFPMCLDYSDDCYYTLDRYGEHSHPATVKSFPARFKVSKALKNKLLSDEYYEYRAYYDNLKVNEKD